MHQSGDMGQWIYGTVVVSGSVAPLYGTVVVNMWVKRWVFSGSVAPRLARWYLRDSVDQSVVYTV